MVAAMRRKEFGDVKTCIKSAALQPRISPGNAETTPPGDHRLRKPIDALFLFCV